MAVAAQGNRDSKWHNVNFHQIPTIWCWKFLAIAIQQALSCASLMVIAQTAANTDQLFPNAKPGECYAKAYIAPTFGTDTQQVLKRSASVKIDVTPAQYQEGSEQVLVREASKRLEVIPATYKTAEETIEVSPAGKRLDRIPGATRTESEQALVKAARTYWKRGANPYGFTPVAIRKDASGEILCLVEEPAVYKTVTHTVRDTDTFREVDIPAVSKTVRRTVVDQPASTREVDIPAVYETVKTRKMVTPPQEVKTDIPTEYQTVTSTKQLTESRYEWRSILCETNATQPKIREIQAALKEKGFDPGPLDGVIRSRTMGALNSFRQSKGLPTDSYLTVDSLAALGVAAK